MVAVKSCDIKVKRGGDWCDCSRQQCWKYPLRSGEELGVQQAGGEYRSSVPRQCPEKKKEWEDLQSQSSRNKLEEDAPIVCRIPLFFFYWALARQALSSCEHKAPGLTDMDFRAVFRSREIYSDAATKLPLHRKSSHFLNILRDLSSESATT